MILSKQFWVKKVQNWRSAWTDRCAYLYGKHQYHRPKFWYPILSLFTDSNKFKKNVSDPTPTRLSSLQRYLFTFPKRSEITDTEYNVLHPRAAHFDRAHGLPKIYKTFSPPPKFCPIVNTTNSLYYNVGKFLLSSLNPLTIKWIFTFRLVWCRFKH